MFNSKHYVPILKWKRAEQNALEKLKDENKELITPLIQLVMPKPTLKNGEKKKSQDELFIEVISKFQESLPNISEKLLKFWGASPIFIDFSFLYTTSLKIDSLKEIIGKGVNLGLNLIPVLNLSDQIEIIKTACSINKHGLCLRLVSSDLANIKILDDRIKSFLASCHLTEKYIDLLVDIKENNDSYLTYLNLSQQIPNILNWRTFTFASGAFPKNLSNCKIDEENLIPRLDWQNWKDKSQSLKRNPSFADYTIQHPIYDEASQYFAPTTSIKYALENVWLILKGGKHKYEYYLANAKLLSEDNRFFGANFSDGDKYIVEKANHYNEYIRNPNIKGTGNTETWLIAGINHHLVCTANQIANLS